MNPGPSVLLVYHFFHPDDVVSAVLYTQLALELKRRGWSVTVLTSNRSCRTRGRSFRGRETWKGIDIIRSFRPDWTQSRPVTRLLNSAWLLCAWACRLCFQAQHDVVIVGSDPTFAPMIILWLRWLKPGRVLVHWCHDLFPEAITAEGQSRIPRFALTVARSLMAYAYRASDLLVDLGACMKQRLAAYGTAAQQVTLAPWALVEPAELPTSDSTVRRMMFGDAQFGVLYSGNLGRAHRYEGFLDLARKCRAAHLDIAFCFACRGFRSEQLRVDITAEDANIRLLDFVNEEELERHLAAADFHLISLREEWSGIVVPSKFFGSLAVGRPVLYDGPENSAIGQWIREMGVGAVIDSRDLSATVRYLRRYALDVEELRRLQTRAFQTYRRMFSLEGTLDRWDGLLRAAMAIEPARVMTPHVEL